MVSLWSRLLRFASLLLLFFTSFVWFFVSVAVDPLLRCFAILQQPTLFRLVMGFWTGTTLLLLRFWRTRFALERAAQNLPENRTLIFVANHHSSIDILLLMHFLSSSIGRRKLRFISRPQLDRNIPGVSFYLRRYCYSLGQHQKRSPERKSDRAGMADFAQQVASENGALVIFPEGVKARGVEEHTRPFYRSGLKTLLEQMPNALVIPVSLSGSGCFYTTPRKPADIFSMPPVFSVNIGISILPAVDMSHYESIDAVVDHCEFVINRDYHRQTRSSDSAAQLSPEGSHPSA